MYNYLNSSSRRAVYMRAYLTKIMAVPVIMCLMLDIIVADIRAEEDPHGDDTSTEVVDIGGPSAEWKLIEGKYYLYNTVTGEKLTGWQEIGGSRYYLNSSGVMQTGWVTVKKKIYYLDTCGRMATGWRKISGKTYYFSKKNGYMLTGWHTLGGKKYHFAGSGVVDTGWKKISGKKYHFSSTGVMATGFKKIGSKKYYFNSKGVMKTGWVKTGGKWYYLSSSGPVQTGWKKWKGSWYYLKSSGAMVTGLRKIGKNYCYFNKSGSLRTGRKPKSRSSLKVHININTYSQNRHGYPLGCEGVSLYMALKGLGYCNGVSLRSFMNTMPKGSNPYKGYMGNPRIGRGGSNRGKRTSIYPGPVTKWANRYAHAKNLTGASVSTLKKELDKGHVIVLWATNGWNRPYWKRWSWSRTKKGEVTNNHCICVVGYYSDGSFIINDCGHHYGEYRVSASRFRSVYNARRFAVSVY